MASIMDVLPWPAITAASGGWFLFAGLAWLVLRKLISADLVTRREHDEALAAIKAERARNDEFLVQLGYLKQVGLTVEQLARGLQERMDP